MTVLQSATNPNRAAALTCLAAAARTPDALPPLELLFPFVAATLEGPSPNQDTACIDAEAAAAYSLVTALAAHADVGPDGRVEAARGCLDAVAVHAVRWLERLQLRLEVETDDSHGLLQAVAAVAGFLLGRAA